jgi:beta-barrel assembly-enhancing protease
MNVERIEAAQDEIRKYLPDRPEYVVDTSEFENIKARLASWENGRRLHHGNEDPGRPVLLKRASTNDSGSGTSTQDSSSPSNQQDSGRPTLKRTPSSDGSGSSTQDASGAGQSDDGPPTLKRSPTTSD